MTLPDGIVMNGIRYPAEEIQSSFESLENTPAPLGHPRVNGQFVSALSPAGIVAGFIGAWNEKPRRVDGRVLLDKVIDVGYASQLEGGKQVLNAIEKGEPIHTSTGLLCKLEACVGNQADGAKFIARQIVFDHDAILLNEDGAATPEQGVGMLVNGESVEIINSMVEERAEREMDWAVDSVLSAIRTREEIPRRTKIKNLLLSLLGAGTSETLDEDDMKTKENANMANTEDLAARLAAIENSHKTLGETIAAAVTTAVATAVAPLVAAQNASAAAAAAAEKAEKDALVNQVVKANLLSETAAQTLTNAALKELVANVKTGKAAPLGAGFAQPNTDDMFAGYTLNSAIDEGQNKKDAH